MNIDLKGLSVMLAMPTHKDIHPAVVQALLSTQMCFIQHGVQLELNLIAGGAYVECARNHLTQIFLAGPHNRLFWVDSDVVWNAEDFLRLVAFTTELEVVSAIYPFRRDPPAFCLTGMEPGAKVKKHKFGCISFEDLSFGMGFTCVQRKMMEELSATSPSILMDLDAGVSQKGVPGVFRCSVIETEQSKTIGADGTYRGEDIHFFNDVRALGYDVWIDPMVTLGHMGTKMYVANIEDSLLPIVEDGTGGFQFAQVTA